jgi:hypothetical protein
MKDRGIFMNIKFYLSLMFVLVFVTGCSFPARFVFKWTPSVGFNEAYAIKHHKRWTAFNLKSEYYPERNQDVIVLCTDAEEPLLWIANKNYLIMNKSRIVPTPAVYNVRTVKHHGAVVADHGTSAKWPAWTAYCKRPRAMYHVPQTHAPTGGWPSQTAVGNVVQKFSGTNYIDIIKIFEDMPNCQAVFIGDYSDNTELPRPGPGANASDLYRYILPSPPNLVFLGESDIYDEIVQIVNRHKVDVEKSAVGAITDGWKTEGGR